MFNINTLSFKIYIILFIQQVFIYTFEPYVNNQAQSLIDIDIKWEESNKDFIYLEDVDIHAYYIINDDDDRTHYPAIQAIQNGQLLGDPIKLSEENFNHNPNGLSLCKTGDDSFVLFFTIPNDDQFSYTDGNGDVHNIQYYEQHIRFVHFSRFNSKMKYTQSEIKTVAINEEISYDRPQCTYFPSQEKVQFIYRSNLGQQIHTNTIYLGESKKYQLEHDSDGFILIEDMNNYIDRFKIAFLSNSKGYIISYSLRPPTITEDDAITTKIRIESFKNYEIQNFVEIQPSTDHKWTFDPKLEINQPQQAFIISWWEDLSIRYQIYNFDFQKICDNEIEESQRPHVTSWGNLGIISFKNSTGNYIQEINLQTCELYIDKLKVLYDLWGEDSIQEIPSDIKIQKGQEVTLQVLFQDKLSQDTQQLSFVFSQCKVGCGDCDDTESCNKCVPSRRNHPVCDVCNDGYIEKNNDCFSCKELYGDSCLQCNEYNCICESNLDTCNTCVGQYRDIIQNCACQEGFQEDIVTKQCEFIPCKKGYYENQYKCLECYWIKDSDYCYEGECPNLYTANQDTYECMHSEQFSWLLIFIIIGLSLLLIIIVITTCIMIHRAKKQNKNAVQAEEFNQRDLSTTRKINGIPEHSMDYNQKNTIQQSMEQSINTQELISPMKSRKSTDIQSPIKSRSRTRQSKIKRNLSNFIIPEQEQQKYQ